MAPPHLVREDGGVEIARVPIGGLVDICTSCVFPILDITAIVPAGVQQQFCMVMNPRSIHHG